jgi:hypothetical protein
MHRAPYGSSRHGGDERVREDLEPLFAWHGVDLVFAGDDHVYERTVPIGGDLRGERGRGQEALPGG